MNRIRRTRNSEAMIWDIVFPLVDLIWEIVLKILKGVYVIGRTLLDITVPSQKAAGVGKCQYMGFPSWMITIPYSDRPKGVHIIGPTGSGKSVLMKNLATSDMRTDATVIVIDPKGDTAKTLLGHIPSHRIEDVVFFDLTETSMPIGINPLQGVPPNLRTRATSDVVMTFKKIFHKSWGVRMEHFLRMAVAALIETKITSTLLDIPRLFTNEVYRNQVISSVSNPLVRWFWEEEFAAIHNRRSFIMIIEPILNKLSLLNFPEVANVIGQPDPKFNLVELIKNGGTLLAHIPQSSLGEDVSQFLCAILFTQIQLITMSQESGRTNRNIIVHADEFQTYISGSFEKALTEGRSFNLCLCLAHQYPQQLDRSVRAAIDHNVGVRLTCQRINDKYRVTYQRAQDPSHIPELLIPLSPLNAGDDQVARRIRMSSKQKYGRPKLEVENQIIQRIRPEDDSFLPAQLHETGIDGLASIWSN